MLALVGLAVCSYEYNFTIKQAHTEYSTSGVIAVNPSSVFPSNLTMQESVDTDSSELVHEKIKEQLEYSSRYDADVVVIGSGPGGYVAAIRAAQLGARTVVVEKGSVGGVCLNVGCIPTKTLLSTVAVINHADHASDFGVDIKGYELNIPNLMKKKNDTVKKLVGGVESLFKKNKIKLVRGLGSIEDIHTVTVKTDSGEEKITTDKIVVATGSTPARLPLPGFETGKDVWTSTEALEFEKLPKSILVIGAGAIGLEFGYTFARMGSKVKVVEMMDQILPAADTETANELQKHLEKQGMEFVTGAGVTKAENAKGGKKVYIKHGSEEKGEVYEKVLVAVGRRAAVEGIGLENVGINTENGKIVVDENMQTNVSGIYAIGDCIGEPMLAHVGWTEGIVAVEHAFGMNSRMDYKAWPACVYTMPECASVGLTEEQVRDRFKTYKTGKFGFNHNGKAMGMGETEGFVKFIVGPKYGQILGVHIVGPHATDLIAEATMAIKNELTVAEVIATIHAHPTLSEVVQEAAYDSYDRAIHK